MKALLGPAVWFAVLCVGSVGVTGCGKDSGKSGTGSQPGPGASGKFGPGGPQGKRRPIAEIMGKLTKGPQSLTTVIGQELEADPPPWDKLQSQSKEFAELARTMGKYDPPKGSKESWAKMTSAYTDSAVALEQAVEAKDKNAALAAHQTLSNSCKACHSEHKGIGGIGWRSPTGVVPCMRMLQLPRDSTNAEKSGARTCNQIHFSALDVCFGSSPPPSF